MPEDPIVDLTGDPDTGWEGIDLIDLIDLDLVKGNFRSDVDRDWFAVRYNDIMKKIWNTRINVDADQRPTLLMRKRAWMSGHDVDGTADANLGEYAGKSVSRVNFHLPSKHFDEHGVLWIMCLPRMPALHYSERSPIFTNQNPDYLTGAMDPAMFSMQPPVEQIMNDWFEYGSKTKSNTGFIPYGQEWRTHPNFINDQYKSVSGFPFTEPPGGDGYDPRFPPTLPPGYDASSSGWKMMGAPRQCYYRPNEFNSIFQTAQLSQWQSNLRVDVTASRYISGVKSSIYAGGK